MQKDSLNEHGATTASYHSGVGKPIRLQRDMLDIMVKTGEIPGLRERIVEEIEKSSSKSLEFLVNG